MATELMDNTLKGGIFAGRIFSVDLNRKILRISGGFNLRVLSKIFRWDLI